MNPFVATPSDQPLDTWVSFADLRGAGIVDNWVTLRRWQQDPEIRFPAGRLFGPNTRRWALRGEIQPWLASRPNAGGSADVRLHRERSRPRKRATRRAGSRA